MSNNNGENQEQIVDEEAMLKSMLEPSSLERAFSTPQSTDNIKYLMTPGGDDPLNIYMRADIPNTKTALALAIRDERCQEHDDEGGKRKILKMVACLIGVQAKRVNVVSDTMIGERRNHNIKQTLGDWIRDKTGNGEHNANP